jgi:ATP-dependent protease Clp ATPase subunit
MRALISVDRAVLRQFQPLNQCGEYSVEFTCHILELIAMQEKTGNPQAFMFRGVLEAILNNDEIFRIVSAASFRGR